MVSLEPSLPIAYLAPPRPAPGEPSPLANQLRAELRRARLLGAQPVPGERACVLRFERGGRRVDLWLELFGREANLYLVDAEQRVLVTPRGNVADRRSASVGSLFAPPPPAPERVAALTLAPDERASDLLRTMATGTADERRMQSARGAIGRIVRRGLSAARRRLERLDADEAKAAEAEAWQAKGELLRGAFHLLAPGQPSVRVPDYTRDPPREVEVELDPALAPGEQVGRCFQRARKLRAAAERAVRERPEAMAALDTLQALRAALPECADLPALEALARELPDPVRAKALGALASLADGGATKARPPARLAWRTYTSADGWPIRVGRSASDSDALTLRGSRPHDLFLHVRGVPGAHVIVPTPRGKTVPKETLLDAAELACMHSKRAEAPTNEVDYTERRYVRKPKGAKAGLVLVERAKTLSLRRDDARRARLRGARRLDGRE